MTAGRYLSVLRSDKHDATSYERYPEHSKPDHVNEHDGGAVFYFAGSVMNYAGITGKLLDLCDCLLGTKEGGLAYVNVLLIHSTAVCAARQTRVPRSSASFLSLRWKKKGYPRAFCTVVTAASSLITPIIPPGVPLILYGIMTAVSVGKMWVAGYVPGIMLA